MNASLYFELVDAVAKVDGEADLAVVAERVAETPMHPLERRVLDRALRARSESMAIRCQLASGDVFPGSSDETSPHDANG